MMSVAEWVEIVGYLLEWDSRRRSQVSPKPGKMERLAEEN
jgi:hypothetical protein